MFDFSKVTEHKMVVGQWSQALRHKVKPSRSPSQYIVHLFHYSLATKFADQAYLRSNTRWIYNRHKRPTLKIASIN